MFAIILILINVPPSETNLNIIKAFGVVILIFIDTSLECFKIDSMIEIVKKNDLISEKKKVFKVIPWNHVEFFLFCFYKLVD